MSDLLNSTLGLVGEAGDAIDRFTGGRALRGTLAGKPRELASVIPFSDSLGLTDAHDQTSGRDLTDQYGLTTKGDTSFGSHAAGFGADMLLSPANLLGAYGAAKAAPTLAQGAVAAGKALSGLDLVEHVGSGIKALGRLEQKALTGEFLHPTLDRMVPGWRAAEGAAEPAAGAAAGGLLGDEAGALQFHDFDKNPINQGQRTLMKHHNNASKAVRYSEDPARAKFYAGDRNARFRAHMGHGERPSYGGPPSESNLPDALAGFMGDESGAWRVLKPGTRFDPNHPASRELLARIAMNTSGVDNGGLDDVLGYMGESKGFPEDYRGRVGDVASEAATAYDAAAEAGDRAAASQIFEFYKNHVPGARFEGKVGEVAPFDPANHRDVSAGEPFLEPGDPAQFHSRGLGVQLPGSEDGFLRAYTRARVTRPGGGLLGKFLSDDSGAMRLHLPQGAAEEFAGRTDNPLGRLAAYSDAAGAKLHLPENYDDWRSAFGPGPASNSYAVYQPRERVVVPNTHDFGAQWTQDPAMAAEMKSAPPDYFSTGNRDHLGLHEIGHALHHAKHPGGGAGFFDRLESYAGFRPSEAKEIAGQLSRYGSTHTAEFVAEKFARDAVAHGRGGQLPNFPGLAERYQQLGGPEIPTRLRDQLTRFLGGERGSLKLGAADAAGATPPVAQAQQVAQEAIGDAARQFGHGWGKLPVDEAQELAARFLHAPQFPEGPEGLDQAQEFAGTVRRGMSAADRYFSPDYYHINKHLRDLGPEGAAQEVEAIRSGQYRTADAGGPSAPEAFVPDPGKLAQFEQALGYPASELHSSDLLHYTVAPAAHEAFGGQYGDYINHLGLTPPSLNNYLEAINAANHAGDPAAVHALAAHAQNVYPDELPDLFGGGAGSPDQTPDVRETIDGLMGLLEHSRMPEAMDLYRGVDGPGQRKIEQLLGAPLNSPEAVGREFVDPGFLSTAYEKSTANSFAGLEPGYNRPDAGVTFSFPQVPAGKPASLMNSSENEILFPPGRKIKITDNKNFPHLKAELYTLLAAIMGGRAAQHYNQG